MKQFFSLIFFSIWLLLSGCGSEQTRAVHWMKPSQKVKVLTTISMIEDLVKEVGKGCVETLSLVSGELDPHTYQLVKGDDEKLAAADIIFYNGLGLEHGPSLRRFLTESQKAVNLGDRVMKERPELILHYNGTLDPHIWMDIGMWKKTVKHIVEVLADVDPRNAAMYQTNGKQLEERLEILHQKVANELHAVPQTQRFLVTSHDAFNYFARSYLATEEERKSGSWQKRFAAPEGLAPESQLSTEDIRLILDHMKKYDIRVIFPESNVSQASIRKLVNAGEEMGMTITIASQHLYGDAMGPPGSNGDTYFKMLRHNAMTIAKNLGGRKNESG